MNVIIRPITTGDEPFLWQALYYAAHLDEEDTITLAEAKNDPQLIKYVAGWGRAGDMGFLALDPHTLQPLGAAWLRLFTGPDKIGADDATPELAIAVLPGYSGKGLGTQLLTQIVETARQTNSPDPSHPSIPALVLSVRIDNPARRLYERFGFVVVGTLTNRVGTKSWVMLARLA